MRYGINAFLLVFLLTLSSCSPKDSSKKFIGEWWLIHADLETPNLASDFVASARQTLESSIFYFEEENHFQIEDTSFSGGSYLGTWEYVPENKQIVLVYDHLPIDPEIYDVIKISRGKMVIRQTLEDIGTLEYTLVRKK